MALRGINLPLAWIGFEKILIEVFQEIGFTDAEIGDFISGPAFLAWNHFGNIQGSWGGSMPYSWAESQFSLQLKIVQRMVELGMTPILPAFPGFVPPSISRIYPNANVSTGSVWEAFPARYTSDTFLDPLDPLFKELQIRFIAKQKAYYGNVTSYYTLDQFNENNPSSGDLGYLQSEPEHLEDAQSRRPRRHLGDAGLALLVQRGLLDEREGRSLLGGVTVNSDMLILDLFSESQPQWQRTSSFYGKPWVWCELHDYGGNQGLYGQIMNITINSVQALHNTSNNLVGFGLAPEGWKATRSCTISCWTRPGATRLSTPRPISMTGSLLDTEQVEISVPDGLYSAWEILRPTVFNNTNLAANAVPKSILELIPSTSGLINRTGHHPTLLNYDPKIVVHGWNLLYQAGLDELGPLLQPSLQV